MTKFQLLGDATPRPVADWAPPLAGLAAAVVVAYVACPVPRPHSLSWPGLIATALLYAAAVALAAGFVTLLGYAMAPRPISAARRAVVLRTSVTALWCAPAAFFVTERSAWGFVAGAALVASITRLLYDCRRVFGAAPTRRAPKFYSAICISVCAETGIVAGYMGWTIPAAVLLSAAVAILTWRLAGISSFVSRARQSLAAMAGILLLFGGLTPYLKIHPRFGAGGAGSRADPGPLHDPKPSGSAAFAENGDYSGVILWPEIEKHVTLVPPRPAMNRKPFAAASEPLEIPFYGAYWYFRAPDKRPPPDSFVLHGNAAVTGFRSADHRPLSMEARQNFGRLIELSCCSGIRVVIANADRYAGTVSLELILINTSIAEHPSQSLGKADVTSIPRQAPVDQTLNFSIPSDPAIRQFDEVTIRFHLDPLRIDRGAKIAIEKFVLIPRGL